jgi:hypothetical protein
MRGSKDQLVAGKFQVLLGVKSLEFLTAGLICLEAEVWSRYSR